VGANQTALFVARAAALRTRAPGGPVRGTPAERAAQTGANERTLRRQADQFETEGLLSFFRPTKEQLSNHHRLLPPPLRQLIVDLKADHLAFSLREIAQICYAQFGRRLSQPTIKQVLANGPACREGG
jgi:hypothetical protein